MKFNGESGKGTFPGQRDGRERFEGDHWVLESELSLGNEVADTVIGRLVERGWTEEQIGLFHNVIKETVDNAVIHGNWGIQKRDYPNEDVYRKAVEERGEINGNEEKKVTVDIKFSSDGEGVEVIIHDEGPGFAPEDIPDPTSGEGITRTSGRGWYLITSLASADISTDEGKVVLHWKKDRPVERDAL